MPHYSRNPYIDREVQKYISRGWVFLRGGKHGKLRSLCGRVLVIVPSTPSDHRAHRNFSCTLRQAERQLAAMK